jgi:VCBS repeat-containing protein
VPTADPDADPAGDQAATDTPDTTARTLSRGIEDNSARGQLLSTDAQEVDVLANPVAATQNLAALPGAVVSVATTLVSALLAPLLVPGPTAPAEPPLLWAVLGWVRREIARTFFNKTPVAVDDTTSTSEDTPTTITVLANDDDDDPLAIDSFTRPEHGTVVKNLDGTFTYTPDEDWSGTDTFTYTLSDAQGPWHLHGLLSLFTGQKHTDAATVTVTVGAVGDAPVADDDTYETDEDTPLTIDPPGVLGNDADADDDDLTVTIDIEPTDGSVTLNPDGSFTYTPDEDFTGTDEFTYTVTDGTNTDTASVSITVNPVNDPPVADDETLRIAQDTPVQFTDGFLLNGDTDDDDDSLTVEIDDPTEGTLESLGNGMYRYTPPGDFTGSVTLAYTVSDGNGGTDTGELTVTVVEPSVIETAVLTGDSPFALAVDDDGTIYQLFNPSGASGLSLAVIEPSDRDNPTIVELPGASTNLTVGGDGTIYYRSTQSTSNLTRVVILDLADPTNPTTVDLPGFTEDPLQVTDDGFVYVSLTRANPGLTYSIAVIDPADPTNPTIVSLPAQWEEPLVMGADGTAAVVSRGTDAGQIVTWVTMIDPAAAEDAVTAQLTGDPLGEPVLNADGMVYQLFRPSGGTATIAVIDPTDHQNPVIIDTPTLFGTLIHGGDGKVYFHYTDAAGVHITVIDPVDPDNAPTYDVTGRNASNLVVGADGTMYIVLVENGIDSVAVINPADPDNPTVVPLTGNWTGSPPIVGTNGTFYIGTINTSGDPTVYVNAIGPADPDNPTVIELAGRAARPPITSPDGSVIVPVLGVDDEGNPAIVLHVIGVAPAPIEV